MPIASWARGTAAPNVRALELWDLRRVIARAEGGVGWSMVIALGFGLVYIALAIGFAAALPRRLAIGAVLTAFGIGMVGLAVMLDRKGRGQTRERNAARLARIGLCLCCDYDLAGLPTEADGCTVCPECGAAWRLGTSMGGP